MVNKKDKNSISEEDKVLFQEAMRQVIPLKKGKTIKSVDVLNHVQPTKLDETTVNAETNDRNYRDKEDSVNSWQAVELGEALKYKQSNTPHRIWRQMSQAKWRFDAQLDLHGMTVSQASKALDQFIVEAMTFHYRHLRIIHGKGLSSPDNKPVIKSWLAAELKTYQHVVAYKSAHPSDGGVGALNVLLV